jgi:hypothetical protein
LPPAVVQRLKVHAATVGREMSEIAEDAIGAYLDRGD